MTTETNPPKAVADSARRWWRSLQRTHPNGDRNPQADPGALARLRRCPTPAEAMAEPATLSLFHALGLDEDTVRHLPRVAVIAMVLAHVRDDAGSGRAAIQAVGKSSKDSEPKLSELRFRRLLACREEEELAREMRRFVAIADKTVNVGDLARSLFYWGDSVRARWAFHYYGAGFAAPDLSSEETP